MNTRLTVDVPKDLWMSSNRPILNTGHRSRVVAHLHRLAALAATGQRLTPHDRPVRAVWTVRYPKGTGWKHGDPANAHPTTKALMDGLVLEKYLEGDGPMHVRSETFQRGPNLERASWHALELELEHAGPSHGAEPERMRSLYLERFGL